MADPGRHPIVRIARAGASRRILLLASIAALGLLTGAPSGAEIYRWTDAEGRTHFSTDLGQVPASKRAAALEAAKTPVVDTPIQRYDPAPARRAPAPRASGASASAAAGRATYRVPVQRAGTSLLVNVRINGRVTARFLADTGATDVLIPKQVADELGLEPSGRTKVYSTANGQVTHDLVSLDSVELGGATAHNVVASISPHMNVGLLGLSFFNHFQYAVDPVKGEILLTPNGLTEAGLIRAGRSRAQWEAEYGHIRSRIQYTRDRRDGLPSSRSRSRRQLDQAIGELERELALLQQEADRAHVPHSWRR